MDTMFMKFENGEISEPYSLLLNLAEKITSKRSGNYVALSNLSYIWKT